MKTKWVLCGQYEYTIFVFVKTMQVAKYAEGNM
jgi:hypothetical protein